MNRKSCLLLLIVCGCSSPSPASVATTGASIQPKAEIPSNPDDSPFDAESATVAIKAWHAGKVPDESFQEIQVFPVPDAPNLCVAICDNNPGWWGTFGLYELHEGNVVWQADCETEPTEHSVLHLRGLRLAGFDRPIIEVYGQTHMGNGNLYLYELRNRTLVLLLQTRAVDGNAEGQETFQEGRLLAEYSDLNGDGIADLLLNGVVEEYPEDGAENADSVVATHPCQKAFLWNKEFGKFEEDHSRRIGLKDDDDR